MKYGRFTRLAGLFGLVLLSGFSRTDFEDDDLLKERILYSDLVVRGVITDIETGLVTMDNWLSATHRPDRRLPITKVELDIKEVIKGYWQEQRLTFVSPGGYPPDSGDRDDIRVDIHIDTDRFKYSYNYTVGEEIIVALRYSPRMVGGSYMVGSDEGRYIKRNGEWVNQGTNEASISIKEMRELARSVEPVSLVSDADVVVSGIVREVSIDTLGRFTEIQRILLSVDRIWKGTGMSDKVEFAMVIKRGKGLPWYRGPVPAIGIGEEWVCFLKNGPCGLFPFAGMNSLLQLVGDEVVRNKSVRCSYSRSDLLTILKESGGMQDD
jgi:hypothetical protein